MINTLGLCRNNYIFCVDELDIAEVAEVYVPKKHGFDMISANVNGMRYSKFLDQIEYIPVSAEWLEKLGFNYNILSRVHQKLVDSGKVFIIHQSGNNFYLSVKTSNSTNCSELVSRIDLKYIHE